MESDVTITQYDPTSTSSTADAVVAAVSEFKSTNDVNSRRLEECVDVDGINTLFGGLEGSVTGLNEGALSFRYDDVFVTVTHDGRILVADDDVFYAQSNPHGLSADGRADRSPEDALDIAAAALAVAEDHIWTAACSSPDGEDTNPLWEVVEQIWGIQTALNENR